MSERSTRVGGEHGSEHLLGKGHCRCKGPSPKIQPWVNVHLYGHPSRSATPPNPADPRAERRRQAGVLSFLPDVVRSILD